MTGVREGAEVSVVGDSSRRDGCLLRLGLEVLAMGTVASSVALASSVIATAGCADTLTAFPSGFLENLPDVSRFGLR